MVNDQFVLVMMHNAHNQVKIYDRDGTFVRDVPVPPYVAVEGISGKRAGDELFIEYVSYLYPRNVTHFNFANNEATQLHDVAVDFAFDNYETTQVWYTSKDGTHVSMFLTHRKDLELNSQNPVLLYGYGGFSVPKLPEFAGWILNWLELGGIMAVANLRGGSEYGEAWHSAGALENKQNVFDDFIAAGEYLVEESYTNPSRLAIMGRSNGGLLVAACMQQRPDLFGAVICIVPVTDMLRYHKFTGRALLDI